MGEGLRAEESRPEKHGTHGLADGVFILPLPPPINDCRRSCVGGVAVMRPTAGSP